MLACVTWSAQWQGMRVQAQCDNQAAVHNIAGRMQRQVSPPLPFLLRGPLSVSLGAVYLPGAQNGLANDLSHDVLPSFLSKAPGMNDKPSLVPPNLSELLLGVVNWTSPSWTEMFLSSLFGVSPSQPRGHIDLA